MSNMQLAITEGPEIKDALKNLRDVASQFINDQDYLDRFIDANVLFSRRLLAILVQDKCVVDQTPNNHHLTSMMRQAVSDVCTVHDKE
jgi:hypothetical protein